MNWVDHTIWWHVYPLGFVGAPIRRDSISKGKKGWEAHRISQIIAWLDYLTELGCNGLLLAPVFESTSHGYDALDQFHIDPRLGNDSDFDSLVKECKNRGIRILLDGVFSHVSRDHPLLQSALLEGPDCPDARLFDIDWDGRDGPAPRVFEGHGDLVRLSHGRPETEDYVVSVMKFWLDRGIDGWRLDAAYSVPTWFWAKVIPKVKKAFPEAWFLAEVIHGDYPEFVSESKVDSLTQYELWKAIWSSLLDDNLFELDWTMKRNNELLDTFIPNTFIGNHDVTRITTTLGREKSLIALVILMTLSGIPSIYYGDEQGFTGVKVEDFHGDDAIRPPMPDSPEGLLPFGANHYIAHQRLIGLRRNHPWLVHARTEVIDLENQRITYRSVDPDSENFIEVQIDLANNPSAVILDSVGTELLRL